MGSRASWAEWGGGSLGVFLYKLSYFSTIDPSVFEFELRGGEGEPVFEGPVRGCLRFGCRRLVAQGSFNFFSKVAADSQLKVELPINLQEAPYSSLGRPYIYISYSPKPKTPKPKTLNPKPFPLWGFTGSHVARFSRRV